MEPCGIPNVDCNDVESSVFIVTHCSLCSRYEANKLMACSEKLKVVSLFKSMLRYKLYIITS